MNNYLILLFLLISYWCDIVQAKHLNKKHSTAVITKKITKKSGGTKYVHSDLYADLQTSPLNRPAAEEKKKKLFTPAQRKPIAPYDSPNLNDWAADNPRIRKCDVGELHVMGKSFTLTSSTPASKDPFKKPLPGPR